MAIQYLARNEAELIGNVVAKQDSLTLQTEKGYYYGNLRKTKSTSGIILDDTKVVLSADSGEYYFDEARHFSRQMLLSLIRLLLYRRTNLLISKILINQLQPET